MIMAYFLYKGAFPDMSDKNITTLQAEMERESLNVEPTKKNFTI